MLATFFKSFLLFKGSGESPLYDILENFDPQTLYPVYVTLEKPEPASSTTQQPPIHTAHNPQHSIYETCLATENSNSTSISRRFPTHSKSRQYANENLSAAKAELHCSTSMYASLDAPGVYQTLNTPNRRKGFAASDKTSKRTSVQQDRDLSEPSESSNGLYQPLFPSQQAIYYRLHEKLPTRLTAETIM